MIDISKETAVPLAVAARNVVNRKGTRGVNVATVWRWINRGVKGVRLESVMIGGVRCTTKEAMERFYAAVTAAAGGQLQHPTKDRQRAIDAANAALDAAGIV